MLLVAFVSITILISTRFFDLFNDTLAFRDFDYLNIFTQFICFSIGVEYQFDSKKRIILSFLIYFIFSIIYKSLFFRDFIFVADYVKEIAGMLTYLCSPAAGFVSGAIMDVNGGTLMR